MNGKEIAGNAEMSFEEAMRKLEETAAKLEKGDIPLEKAIDLYTDGMKLANICTKKINEIENRITILTENAAGELEENDFEEIK